MGKDEEEIYCHPQGSFYTEIPVMGIYMRRRLKGVVYVCIVTTFLLCEQQ